MLVGDATGIGPATKLRPAATAMGHPRVQSIAYLRPGGATDNIGIVPEVLSSAVFKIIRKCGYASCHAWQTREELATACICRTKSKVRSGMAVEIRKSLNTWHIRQYPDNLRVNLNLRINLNLGGKSDLFLCVC